MPGRRAVPALLVLLLASASPLVAQRRPTVPETVQRLFTIRGNVRSAANEVGLEMIRVDLKRFTGETVASAYSRNNGEFEFTGLGNGTYIITIDLEGFEPVRETVELFNTSRVGIQVLLRKIETFAPQEPGHAVSARELALPRRARDAMQRGMERLYQKSDYKGSLLEFRKVLAEAPNFYEAHFQTGVAYLSLQQEADAETELRRAIELSAGEYPEAHFVLASILSSRNDFDGAEQLLRKGLALDGEAWQGHYELARALFGLNRVDEAEASARETHRLNPGYAQLHLLSANIYIRKKNYPALLQELDEYLKLEPEGEMAAQARQTRTRIAESLARAQGSSSPPPNPPKP